MFVSFFCTFVPTMIKWQCMFKFNISSLQKTLDNFYYLFNASISFYNENFEMVVASHSVSPICSEIKKTLQHKCLESDNETFNTLKEKKCNAFKYKCHFGLIEIAYPIMINSRMIACILFGPFREENLSIEQIRKNIEMSDLNKKIVDKLVNEYLSISTINDHKFEAIVKLLDDYFDFKKDNQYYSLESDFFYSEIHPYIIDHINEKITVEDLCHHFYLSKKQLYAIFSKNTDLPPKKYINSEKVKRAINLLSTTSLSLEEISERIGVMEYTYFSKMFKKYCNHTPKYYRTPQNKKNNYAKD